jgi:hypothetical protein
VPFATHWVKHVTLLMQLPLWMQPRSCEQHELATQLPHVEPSDGHICMPHVPPLHVPVQHSAPVMHALPSCLHCVPQLPCAQTPLQQSWKFMHGPPSGWQASWQTPPTHVPEQQFAPVAHIAPFGEHWPQFAPQRLCDSCTQI